MGDKLTVPGPPPNLADGDERSWEEERLIEQGELERQSFVNRHNRTEQGRDVLHRLTIAGLYLIFSLLVITVLVASFHLFTPRSWLFLDDNQLQTLHAILVSSIVTGFASRQVSKFL